MRKLDNKFYILFIRSKFVSFLMVGVVNTVFGYSLFSLFIYLGLFYPYAVLFATVLGVLFNYRTIGKIVFNHSDHSRLIPFVFVYVLIYVLNVFGLWAFEGFGIENKYLAGAILLAPLAMISFVLNKKFVFI